MKRSGLRCFRHTGSKRAIARRNRRLGEVAADLTPEQLHRRLVRAASNRLRVAWRRDPWTPGLTLLLPEEQERDLRAALAAAGHDAHTIPHAVLDWCRWKWRRAFLDGRQFPDLWREALAQVPARIRAAGPPPPGWVWEEPVAPAGLAYTLPDRLSPTSKRRRPDPPRGAAPGQDRTRKARAAKPLSRSDYERAVLALAEHREVLAPAMALARDDDARLRLALAFARLVAGEMDYWGWLEALEAARG